MTPVTILKGKYVIQGRIQCVTGLHIGGNDEGIEIGGMDNPVIKHPITGQPYIPGSSLKGKLRSTLEWSLGLVDKHSKHQEGYAAYECKELKGKREESSDPEKWDKAYLLGRLFGPASDEDEIRAMAGPTRLTVRDAFLTQESVASLEAVLGRGMFTEIKTENALDRVTSAANPRSMERVPAGSEFAFTLILDVYDESDRKLLKALFGVMAIVEDTSLGGGGSRGHGQVKFLIDKVEWRPVEYYLCGNEGTPIKTAEGQSPRQLVRNFDPIQWK